MIDRHILGRKNKLISCNVHDKCSCQDNKTDFGCKLKGERIANVYLGILDSFEGNNGLVGVCNPHIEAI